MDESTKQPSKRGVVRVGPAGWAYDDWKGVVYPPRMSKSLHPLTLLSEWFDVVEVNSSFYYPPAAKNCAVWTRKIAANPRFKFTMKLWERFTHKRETEPTQEEIQVFRSGIEPLQKEGRLGAILVQFPWSFRRIPENRLWLARVLDAFVDYPLAVEVRHASWNRPEVFKSFAERGVAFCNIDQPLFHDSLAPTSRVTARLGYVRLHGRNHDDWFREDAERNDRYNYLYSEAELKPWVEKIEKVREGAEEVYVVTNNHYRGQAVVNALEIQEAVGISRTVIPRHLIDEYPSLKRFFH
jgi:uncharacterized protein YecE (DUF72 family)